MYTWVSQMTQWVKNLPAMRESQGTGWEDPLEEEMVTHASILAWRIPQTEEPGGLQSRGSQSETGLKGLRTGCIDLDEFKFVTF